MKNKTALRARVGVLVPYTNTNLEPDMVRLCPPDATMHFTRIGGYDVDEIPGSEQMAGLGSASLDEPLHLLSGMRPDVVLYGCTSATLAHGASFDKRLAQKIKKASGATSLTAAGSLVAALKALNAKNIGFASPYLKEINDQAIHFFLDAEIKTTTCANIGRPLGNYGQGELTPDEVYRLALQANRPEVDAIVLSCTDMRSVESVERIEAALRKPVVTSNQAMVFCMMKLLELPRHDALPGQLFERLSW